MITVHDLSPNVEVRAEPTPPPLPDSLSAKVAALWDAEKARRGVQLFDGLVFSVVSLAPERITGHFAPYRHLIAQRASPDLFAALRVRPLGVSGVLVSSDGVVFGRRAAWVTDNAGCWELVPSGSIDPECVEGSGRVSLHRQTLAELTEEVGLVAKDVTVSDPFCAIESDETHIVDIGMTLTTSLTKGEVRVRQARLVRPEYSELAIVTTSEIPRFTATRGASLVEVSRALLRRKGLL